MASKLLERAFSAAARVPEDDQRAVAEWILEEIRSEERWQEDLRARPGANFGRRGPDCWTSRCRAVEDHPSPPTGSCGPARGSSRLGKTGLRTVQAVSDDTRGTGCCPLGSTGSELLSRTVNSQLRPADPTGFRAQADCRVPLATPDMPQADSGPRAMDPTNEGLKLAGLPKPGWVGRGLLEEPVWVDERSA